MIKRNESNRRARNLGENLVVSKGLPVLMKPGEYPAIGVVADISPCFQRRGLFVTFRIEPTGEEPYMACNFPDTLTPRCKLFKEWAKVLGRCPRPNERFDKDIFLYKHYDVEVVTVERDEHQVVREGFLRYSVVKRIVRVNTGVVYPHHCT